MAGNMMFHNEDFSKVEKAILFLEKHYPDQPSLEEVARNVHLSKYHFQRVFSRWAGISPKRFMQHLTLNHAKELLSGSRSVLEAALESGLSGPARLHDLFVTHDALTPGQYKQRGQGMPIQYGWHASPFGECLLAVTSRGICGLSFVGAGGREELLRDLRKRWEFAELKEAPGITAPWARGIFTTQTGSNPAPLTLHLHLQGTNFQIKVWEALLAIPPGSVASYQDIARAIGRPTAVRAVGTAVGGNPVAFMIPCHRVIRKSGAIGQYRWGIPRKKAMLAWESAQAEARTG